jgi:hypothetical protein
MADEGITKLKNCSIDYFKFPSTLTCKQRKDIHLKVEQFNSEIIQNENHSKRILTDSRGGSYRVLILTTLDKIEDVPKSQIFKIL